MRWLFVVLVLTNGLFFYLMSQSVEQQESQAMVGHPSANPESIRLLSETDANTTLSIPAPAVEPVCLEWGLFSVEDAAQAKVSLQAMHLQDDRFKLVTAPEKSSQFWVFVPPLKTRAEAQKKLDELKALEVADGYIIQDNSGQRFAISLGVFSSKDGADKYLAQIRQKGIKSAKAEPRGGAGLVTIKIKSAGSDFEAALVRLKQETFPDTLLKAAGCGE